MHVTVSLCLTAVAPCLSAMKLHDHAHSQDFTYFSLACPQNGSLSCQLRKIEYIILIIRGHEVA